MSEEDQNTLIVQFVTERTAARRAVALLSQDIRDRAAKLSDAGTILCRYDLGKLAEGRKTLDEIAASGGVDALWDAIAKYLGLQSRIAELSKSLSQVGVD
jgi:hypothetical protein